MDQRAFGWTGCQLPVVGQGTWQMERDDRAACIEAIQRGLDAGMTHVDTAEMYGSGAVETLVGKAIAGRRDEVFLASKVLPSNASYAGTVAACTKSLRRLGTDRLDLYLLHWPGSYPLEETFRAFEDLKVQGKIRYYGVSNFDVSDLERAIAVVGDGKIACNQVLYHLFERAIEHRVLPFCEARSIPVVAYSPFGSGEFPSPRSAGGRVLASIARERGATPRQVALRFLVRRPAVFTIPKAGQVAHALDNAAAGSVRLTDDDLRRLDAAFPLNPDDGQLPVI